MIVKNSSSGRALFVIDEQGNVFSTSWEYIDRLKGGKVRSGFLVLSRLPNKVSVDRFPPSPLWNGSTGAVEVPDTPDLSNDAFSKRNTDKSLKPVGDVVL